MYAATGSRSKAVSWPGFPMAEILGGVLAWLDDSGSLVSPLVIYGAIMAAVAGIMVALSVDELMPLAKDRSASNPSYGVLCGMAGHGAGGGTPDIGHRLAQKQHSPLTSGLCSSVANRYLAGFTLMFATIGHQIFNRDHRHIAAERT